MEKVVKLSESEVREQLEMYHLPSTGSEAEARARLLAYVSGSLSQLDLPSETPSVGSVNAQLPALVRKKKQTPYERARAAERERAERVTKDADAALASFAASLASNDVEVKTSSGATHRMKAFVRGAVEQAGNKSADVDKSVYVPQMNASGAANDNVPTSTSTRHHQSSRGKKRSAMDELKEELARKQAARDERGMSTRDAAHELNTHRNSSTESARRGGAGSQDDG